MSLKNKISAITALSMLAFVGVGFAAWTFNNNATEDVQEGAYVTSAISRKDVTLSGNTEVYLVLDQAKPYWSAAVDTGSKPVELVGGKITVTPDYDLVDQNDGASWTYTISGTMTVDAAIATYVNATGFGSNDTLTGTITAAGDEGVTAVDFDLPVLAYTASKPANYTEYQTMLSAVASAHITFSFNCTFVEA